MEDKKRNITIVIFFFFLVIGLMLVVVGWGMQRYRSTKSSLEGTGADIIGNCVGYVYNINSFDYDSGSITLVVENKAYSSGDDIKTLIVEAENKTATINRTILKGTVKEVKAAINITDTFYVYTPGCGSYKKEFSLNE